MIKKWNYCILFKVDLEHYKYVLIENDIGRIAADMPGFLFAEQRQFEIFIARVIKSEQSEESHCEIYKKRRHWFKNILLVSYIGTLGIKEIYLVESPLTENQYQH